MTKIPLNIDATPLARAVERSKRKTMTKNIMTLIVDSLGVAFAGAIIYAMLALLFSIA